MLSLFRSGSGNEHSSPYMHAIHFSYAVGAVIAPLLAAPFLSDQSLYRKMGNNDTWILLEANPNDADPSHISIPFFIAGGSSFAISLGFLYFGISLLRSNDHQVVDNEDEAAIVNSGDNEEEVDHEATIDESVTEQEVAVQPATQTPVKSFNVIVTIALFCAFCFVFVGIESNYGSYLTTFAVHCDLHLSKSAGAYMTAVYWCCFAAMRFLAIPASVRLNPIVIMTISFVLCAFSSVFLVLYGQEVEWVLRAGSGVFGFGNASVFATGLLWLEQYFEVSGLMAASVTISASVGPTVTAVLLGQVVVDEPMSLMYFCAGSVALCALIFVAMWVFASRAKKDIERSQSGQEQEDVRQQHDDANYSAVTG